MPKSSRVQFRNTGNINEVLGGELNKSVYRREGVSPGKTHAPYSRISHIETITRQPLQLADRACNCWFFYYISYKLNVPIFNMEYATSFNVRIISDKFQTVPAN